MKKPKQVQTRVYEYVVKYGPCSILEVLGAVGRHIPPSMARSAHATQLKAERKKDGTPNDKPYNGDVMRFGRRLVVKDRIKRLLYDGRIVRVSRGIYGPKRRK